MGAGGVVFGKTEDLGIKCIRSICNNRGSTNLMRCRESANDLWAAAGPGPKLQNVDEAHHFPAKTWQQALDITGSYALSRERK
jgi:hypothetical protein